MTIFLCYYYFYYYLYLREISWRCIEWEIQRIRNMIYCICGKKLSFFCFIICQKERKIPILRCLFFWFVLLVLFFSILFEQLFNTRFSNSLNKHIPYIFVFPPFFFLNLNAVCILLRYRVCDVNTILTTARRLENSLLQYLQ